MDLLLVLASSLRSAPVVAAMVVLYPIQFLHLDVRGLSASTLQIQVEKISPAYIALEEIREVFDPLYQHPGEIFIPSGNSEVSLNAGEAISINLVAALLDSARESVKDPVEVAKPQIAEPDRIALAGMTISQEVSAGVEPRRVAGMQPVHPPTLYNSHGELEPLEVRKQKLLNYYGQKNWSPPKLETKAKELVDQELKVRQEQLASGVRYIESSHNRGHGIYVAKPQGSPSRPSRPEEPAQTEPEKEVEEGAAWSLANLDPDQDRPFLIKGQLEITGGLAFTGESLLTISRVQDGLVKETGKVYVSDGRYEIQVEKPLGYLVADLRSPRGEVLGKGEFDLLSLSKTESHLIEIDQVGLKIRPVSTGVQVAVIDAHSYGNNKLAVDQAEVNIEALSRNLEREEGGVFVDEDFHPTSSYVMRAEGKNYWGTIAVGMAEAEEEVRLFPKSMIEALLNLTIDEEDRESLEAGAIVWGRVTEGGKPVAGAKVELAGDHAEPIYFNSLYLPDRSLTETSDNGLFAYVGVTPGIHSVRARFNNRMLPAHVIPAQSRHVSYIDLQMLGIKSADVLVYDGLDENRPVPSTVSIIGSDAEMEMKGRASIKYLSGRGLMMVEAQAEDENYEIARVNVSRQTTNVRIPMVRRDWLATVATRKKVNLESHNSIVVGFVEDDDFEVFLDDNIKYSRENIVYFDSQGRALFEKEGRAGGGFVLFNVPSGFRTVSVLPKNARKFMSQVLVAEPGIVSVMINKIGQ